MRVRRVEESNYLGIFDNLQTTRYRIRPKEPISKLRYPEVVDVSLGTQCHGRCPYCYASALPTGVMYENVVEDVYRQFGSLGENRPFQVAIGGEGEATAHPEFIGVLESFADLDIVPNYTTNGMYLKKPGIIDATKKYCGGVAVTAHKHLPYGDAIDYLLDMHVENINVHVVVGERGSAQFASMIRHVWPRVKYVVLLPYQASGFAAPIDEQVFRAEWAECASMIASESGYAVGALATDIILENPELFACGFSMYDHEYYSGFMRLDGSGVMMKSSYDTTTR